MPEFRAPGVKVVEIERGPRTIRGVATAVGAMIGIAPWGPVGTALRTSSWEDYVRKFGAIDANSDWLPYAAFHYFNQVGDTGDNSLYVVRTAHYTDPNDPATLEAVKASVADSGAVITIEAWAEGLRGNELTAIITDAPFSEDATSGSTSIGDTRLPVDNAQKFFKGQHVVIDPGGANEEFITIDGVSIQNNELIFASPGLTVAHIAAETIESNEFELEIQRNGERVSPLYSHLSTTPANTRFFAESLVNSQDLWVRVTVDTEDTEPTAGTYPLANGADGGTVVAADFVGDGVGTGIEAFGEVDDITIIGAPGWSSDTAIADAMISHCEGRKDRIALLECPSGNTASANVTFVQNAGYNTRFAAIYDQWIYIADPVTGTKLLAPNTGFVMGVYNRTATHRDIWKTPAGITDGRLNDAIEPEFQTSDTEIGDLRDARINAIKKFKDLGTVVWGGVSLSGDPKWFYIANSITANFLLEAMKKGLRWAVFEDNNQTLWTALRGSAFSFLLGYYQRGAFKGATPDKAFFVKCDASLNTPTVVNQGKVIVRFGVAFQKPAEFVVLEFQQDVRALVDELEAAGL